MRKSQQNASAPERPESKRRREALLDFMKRRGLKSAKWARDAGVSASSLYNFLNGLSESLAQPTIEKLADAAGVSVAVLFGDLAGLGPFRDAEEIVQSIGTPAFESGMKRTPTAARDLRDLRRGAHTDAPMREVLPHDVPLRGIAVSGSDGSFEFNGQEIDYVPRPPGCANTRDVFAFYNSGESMFPKYEDGEILFVNPHKRPAPRDYVLVEMLPETGGSPGKALVKRLVRRTAEKIELEQYNPPKTFKVDAAKVKDVRKILTPEELLGL